MSLIYDNRQSLGSTPSAHVLLVGVDEYEHPSMNLSVCVRSATEVAKWLMLHDLVVPLATCRLLVSSASPEIPQLQGSGPPSSATSYEFMRAASEWHKDACSNRENITLFYFAGHGFQRSPTEDLILFSDFDNGLGPALGGAVSVDNLFQGMAPDMRGPDIARTQLYFIDTSRAREVDVRYQLSSPTRVFDEYRTGRDDRSAVIFYSTEPGEEAFAEPGGVSLFTSALLRSLAGEAAVAVEPSPSHWGITVLSLIDSLPKLMSEALSKSHTGVRQAAIVGGLVRDQVIRYLDAPPLTSLGVIILNRPDAAIQVTIESAEGNLVSKARVDHRGTAHFEIPSGFYMIHAEDVGGHKVSKIASLQPGSSQISLVIP